ncbi:MAG: glycosyltransferase [Polyangiales bacterium]
MTVQLPLYNEKYLATRVIKAICDLEYPRDRLQIQVLDDSDDETRDIVDEAAWKFRDQGFDIHVLRRGHREGYKAGALQHGLLTATGDYIAIFDADFVPHPRFLRDLLQNEDVFRDERVAFAQGKWTYLNRHRSGLTEAQAMLLDHHFIVHKPAQEFSGHVTTFNGSGGVWKRSALNAIGGWRSDSITEDLELTYRAALAGYEGRYLSTLEVPNELPPDMRALKLQQRRWAKGSTECVRIVLPKLWRAKMPFSQKLEESLTIAGYGIHPIMVAQFLLWPWAVTMMPRPAFLIAQAIVGAASLAVPIGMAKAARERGRKMSFSLIVDVVRATAVGVGLMFSNTLAVLSAWFSNTPAVFERTPKVKSNAIADDYALKLQKSFYLELVGIAYAIWSAAFLVRHGEWMWSIAPGLWGCAFLIVVGYQLAARPMIAADARESMPLPSA